MLPVVLSQICYYSILPLWPLCNLWILCKYQFIFCGIHTFMRFLIMNRKPVCGVAGLEELEPSAVYRSMLEQLHAYDPKDAKARAMSIRLFLHLPVQLSDFSDPTQSPLSNHLRNRVILSAKVVHVTCSFRCQIWYLEIYTLLEIFGRLFIVIYTNCQELTKSLGSHGS